MTVAVYPHLSLFSLIPLFLASARVVAERLCFHSCLSVHGGEVYTPPRQTPLSSGKTPSLGRHPLDRHTTPPLRRWPLRRTVHPTGMHSFGFKMILHQYYTNQIL